MSDRFEYVILTEETKINGLVYYLAQIEWRPFGLDTIFHEVNMYNWCLANFEKNNWFLNNSGFYFKKAQDRNWFVLRYE